MLADIKALLGFSLLVILPDFWPSVIFLLGFVFFWVLICLISSRAPGGWGSFAKQHPVGNRPVGNAYALLSCQFSKSAASRGIKGVRVIFSDTGVYFYVIFLSRPGHPPFLLPWGSVKSVRKKYGFLGDYYRLHIKDAAGEFNVDLPLNAEQGLSKYHKLRPEPETQSGEPAAITQSRAPAALFTISHSASMFSGILLLAIVIYWLGNSLYKNDLEMPAKHGAVHFYGLSAWLESGSIMCFTILVAGFLIMPMYRSYRRGLLYMAWALLIIGVIVGIWRHGR
jgi:hypothetical protein